MALSFETCVACGLRFNNERFPSCPRCAKSPPAPSSSASSSASSSSGPSTRVEQVGGDVTIDAEPGSGVARIFAVAAAVFGVALLGVSVYLLVGLEGRVVYCGPLVVGGISSLGYAARAWG